MGLSTDELQNIIRIMMIAQLALPSLFVAGLLAAAAGAQNIIRQALDAWRAGQINEDVAMLRARRAERTRVVGFFLALFMFVAATAGPVAYVQFVDVERDSLEEFLTFQTWLFVFTWAAAIGFTYLVGPASD